MNNRFYCSLFCKIIIIFISSCSSNSLDTKNDLFQKKYGSKIKKIKKERGFQSQNNYSDSSNLNPSNAKNLFVPTLQGDMVQDKSNSFDYVDISYLGSSKPKTHFPNYETYQQGINQNPNSSLSPKIFEISYNTYLSPPFDQIGKEFDFIEIPESDSYGVKSSANYKNYTLVPIKSIDNAIRTINSSRTSEDLEFSKKMIAEKKVLLRQKKLGKFQEENQYIKFFRNSSDQAENYADRNKLINSTIKQN